MATRGLKHLSVVVCLFPWVLGRRSRANREGCVFANAPVRDDQARRHRTPAPLPARKGATRVQRWSVLLTCGIGLLVMVPVPIANVAIDAQHASLSTEQRIFAPLGKAVDSTAAELVLNNNSPNSTKVTPIVHSGGVVHEMEPLVLSSGEARWLSLESIVRAPADLLELRYVGQMLQVGAQLTAHLRHGTGSADVMFTGDADFRSSVREAVWSMPHPSRALLVVANSADHDVDVTVEEPGSRARSIRLRAYSSASFIQNSRPNKRVGWIKIESDGPPATLRCAGLIELPGQRIGGTVRFYDPGAAHQPHLFASYVRLRDATLTLALRNTSTSMLVATVRAFGEDGTPLTEEPVLSLLGGESKSADLTGLLQGLADFEHISMQVANSGPPGSLIGSLTGSTITLAFSATFPSRIPVRFASPPAATRGESMETFPQSYRSRT